MSSHRKAPNSNFKPGDKVSARQPNNYFANAVIIKIADYGGGYYAAYDPPNPNCSEFWTCDNYLETR